MKTLAFIILFAATVYADFNESPEEYKKEFGVAVNPKDEKAFDAQLAKEEKEINDHNKGKSDFKEKLNSMSTMTKAEIESEKEGVNLPEKMRAFKTFHTGLVMPPAEERVNTPEDEAYFQEVYSRHDRMMASRATNFDGRAKGYVTAVKNQMNCGSCAAFAATAIHESCMVRSGAKNADTDLSEQHILDCGYDGGSMNACGGASPSAYQSWFAKNGGQGVHQANGPYLNGNPLLKCDAKYKKIWDSGAKVTSAHNDWRCNEDKMKKLVDENGAVMVALYASDGGFGNYASGVYSGCSSTSINHGVTVVGYGNQGGEDYWIVKNSWGPTWGDKGFIKIKRGVNMCGIAGFCGVVKCAKSGGASPAPPTPPEPTVPAKLKCDLSDWFGPRFTYDKVQMHTQDAQGKKRVVTVKCKDSKCWPYTAGPSNGCMYICGKLKCGWSM